uniref:Wall-associated receptor kinase 2-like n=1 Tax=Tanacetum cinerariifolium TaxID=118510 RepID=A0A6L2KG19_TANCI|nr:wall-associated receptor kinase 2-like [Tanacetum cinerariifolium]
MALGTVQGSNSSAMNSIAKPGCQTHRGNITVPYPFGIGKDTGCSLDSSFYLNCNTSFDPPKLYLASSLPESSFEIYNISGSELRFFTSVGSRCYDQNGNVTYQDNSKTALSAFTFSGKNKFTVIGCDDIAVIMNSEADQYASGCFGLCTNLSNVAAGEFSGNGCCQTSITKGLQHYFIEFHTLKSHRNVWKINNCVHAFLGEENTFRFSGTIDLSNSSDLIQRVESSVLVVVDWVIGRDRNCSQSTECKENSECHDADGGGYHCRCNQGYEGNPYLDQGCQGLLINACMARPGPTRVLPTGCSTVQLFFMLHNFPRELMRILMDVKGISWKGCKVVVVSFYESLRMELASKVGITIVALGLPESEMSQDKIMDKDFEMGIDQDMRDVRVSIRLTNPWGLNLLPHRVKPGKASLFRRLERSCYSWNAWYYRHSGYIDAYGPINDDDGGISEMVGVSHRIRERTKA